MASVSSYSLGTEWRDLPDILSDLPRHTVEKLKYIIMGLNDHCSTGLAKTGKKGELVERLRNQCVSWKSANNYDKWRKAKAVINQVKETGFYTFNPNGATSGIPSGYTHASYTNGYAGPSIAATSYSKPFQAPQPPIAAQPPPAATSYGAPLKPPTGIKFNPSPFHRVEQQVSEVIVCPESRDSHDRKSVPFTFSLTNDQRALLTTPPPGTVYQLRLFCTSSSHYTAPLFITNPQCPMEFPPTCEIRINGTVLTANTRGLKKKPGTAPPADLVKTYKPTGLNKVEMIYLNSQTPSPPKKYYMVLNLVQAFSVEHLVDKLKKGKYRSAEDIRAIMQRSLSDDNDIVAGPQKMSLKCPLSYMRIVTPCRSAACVHSQCFDATSWFSVMEQTTTYLCPVCEKTLNTEDLIIDGYFDDILKHTPESVEDVMVEADGEWHTTDAKYASPVWKQKNPTAASTAQMAALKLEEPKREKPKPAIASSQEVFVLDSDDDDEDEDEGRVKNEISPRLNNSTSQKQKQKESAVIDLTLDSDDDDVAQVVQTVPLTTKRKDYDVDMEAGPSKRMRSSDPSVNGSVASSSAGVGSGSGSISGSGGSGGGGNGVFPSTSPRLNGFPSPRAYINGNVPRTPSTSTVASSTSPYSTYLEGVHSQPLHPPPVVYRPPGSNAVPAAQVHYPPPPLPYGHPPPPSSYHPNVHSNGNSDPYQRAYEELFGGRSTWR